MMNIKQKQNEKASDAPEALQDDTCPKCGSTECSHIWELPEPEPQAGLTAERDEALTERDALREQNAILTQQCGLNVAMIDKLRNDKAQLLEALRQSTNALKHARTFILLDDKGKAIYDETGVIEANSLSAIAVAEGRN